MKLLSTIKVADRLGVDDSTVRLWCRQGLFPTAQQVGGSWIIPADALVKFTPPKMGRPAKSLAKKKGSKK
jgi:predicted site-specific integrase-resolvase